MSFGFDIVNFGWRHSDFSARNETLAAKLLIQGYRYYKLKQAFSKFYRRHYKIVY